MWTRIAHFIIKYKLPLTALILLVTVWMGYHARRAELSYDFRGTVPAHDPDQVFFNNFRKQFGEDGNIIAIGLKDSSIYQYKNFEKLRELCVALKWIEGVTNVISLPQIKMMAKDTARKQFVLVDIFPPKVTSQKQLDSLLNESRKQKFYLAAL